MNKLKEEIVRIDGKGYKIASDDDYLDYVKGDFEPQMVKLFKSLAAKSETVLDIGANIGCTAILFSSLSKDVHAFEPSRSTYNILERNIIKSQTQNITTHNIGLGDESCESTITYAPSNRSGGYISNKTQASEGHIVEQITIKTLDDTVSSNEIKNIDFVKLDVEGFEGSVIDGALDTLKRDKPIVVLELNHWCLNVLQRTSLPDFLDFLRGIFPILFAVEDDCYLNLHDEGESYMVMYHNVLHSRFLNVVAAFEENQLSTFREEYKHEFILK